MQGEKNMNQRDLTKGPVCSTIFFFALPMIFGNILQQGYNVADTWVVGHYIGPDALAAVGSAFALMTCLTSVLLGLCMGSGVVFSLCFGRKDDARLESGICAAFLLTAAIAAVLTAGSLAGVDMIIQWMNIPTEIVKITKDYLTLIFCGIPAVAAYNFFGAYLKALGNSVVPLLFLGISTLLNIGLDILFIAGLGKGTAGAAAATVLAQFISGIGIGLYTILKDNVIRHAFSHFRMNACSLLEIIKYSFLTCIQQSVMNFGILLVQGLVNTFGVTVMAGYAAAIKIDAFTYMPVQEYANAFSTFIAQNAGAEKKERISQGIRYAVRTSLCYCIAASFVIWFLAKPLMRIFVGANEADIVAEGVRFLHTVGPFYCGIGCLFLFYGLYRAVGKPGMSVALTVISLGIRVGLSYAVAFAPSVGVSGIWQSIPIGWGIADLTGVLYLLRHRKEICGGA